MTTQVSAAVLPIATTSVLGGVKVDGTTITVDPSTGVITGASTGGTMSIQDADNVGITGGTIATTRLQSYSETVTTTAVSTGTHDLNLTVSNIFDITLNASCAFTFTNPPSAGISQSATIIVRQDAVGNRTATFTNAKFSDGLAPTLSTGANEIDVLTFFTINGGSFWFGTFAMADVS